MQITASWLPLHPQQLGMLRSYSKKSQATIFSKLWKVVSEPCRMEQQLHAPSSTLAHVLAGALRVRPESKPSSRAPSCAAGSLRQLLALPSSPKPPNRGGRRHSREVVQPKSQVPSVPSQQSCGVSWKTAN